MPQRPNEPLINFKDLVSLAMERVLEGIEEIFDQDADEPTYEAPQATQAQEEASKDDPHFDHLTQRLVELINENGKYDDIIEAGLLDASHIYSHIVGVDEEDDLSFQGTLCSITHTAEGITTLVVDDDDFDTLIPYELDSAAMIYVWAEHD